MHDTHQKITASHLARSAYVYVRQSTLHQVVENTESTARQYALRDRAVSLGWPIERIIVIDSDLGVSAAISDREGFKRLVTEVSLGNAGIVLGLEVSRLARNSIDWHRLLELCALSETLIADDDGLYDPSHYNDRLLLGLKGTMSEAELHIIRSRLRGGILNKAKRGELRMPLPIGFCYDDDEKVVLDPDAQVQKTIRYLFETFRRTGSAMQVVKAFNEEGILFPHRTRRWSQSGEFIWEELQHTQAVRVLKNARYAGAFVFGRTKQRKRMDGGIESRMLPRDQWILIKDAHPAYVSWDDFEENCRRIAANTRSFGKHNRDNPAREGPALLQGLVICGCCGQRMTIAYHTHHTKQIPTYYCGRDRLQRGEGRCQSIHGEALDTAVGQLVVEAMTPLALEAALSVQDEITKRAQEADALRRSHVERARHDADLAERRFCQVKPENRNVADTLEADWNDKLRALQEAQDEYEKWCNTEKARITAQQRQEIMALVNDFPKLWCNPQTPYLERKRLMRLIVADVTLLKSDVLHADIRFTGGATRSLDLPLPKTAGQLRATDAELVKEIDRLINDYTDSEIAEYLNERGIRSKNTMQPFTRARITYIRQAYNLKDRRTRLIEVGMRTASDIAKACNVETTTVHLWRRQGILHAHPTNDKGEYLYEIPAEGLPTRYSHKNVQIRLQNMIAERNEMRNSHSPRSQGAV